MTSGLGFVEAQALDCRLHGRVGRLAETADRRVAHGDADVFEQRDFRREAAARPALAMRCSASSWRTVPTRHGTHWPHDSSRKKAAMRSIRSRTSIVSSTTIITPDPSVVPAARVSSCVSFRSSSSGAYERAGGAAEQHGLETSARDEGRRPSR